MSALKYEASAAIRRAMKQIIEQRISGELGFRPTEVTVEDGDSPVPSVVKAHCAIFSGGDTNRAEHPRYRHDIIDIKIVVLVVGAVAGRNRMGEVRGDDPDRGLHQRCQKIIAAVGEWPGNRDVMLLANTLMDIDVEGRFIKPAAFAMRQQHPSTWNSEHSFFGRENFGQAYKKEPGTIVSEPQTGRRDVLTFRGAVRMRKLG